MPDTNGWSLTTQNGWPVELWTVTSAHADAPSVAWGAAEVGVVGGVPWAAAAMAVGVEGGGGPVLTNASAVALSVKGVVGDKGVSIQVRG